MQPSAGNRGEEDAVLKSHAHIDGSVPRHPPFGPGFRKCPPFVKSVKRTLVETAFPAPGKKILFLFDYGDNWRFRIELLEIEPVLHKNPAGMQENRGKNPFAVLG
ncbi:MAG: hypothetical protein METHP_00553 [Methanoregula sp. SKADARSKE-2]|nr:MAG: hypothetical protein METHP_00553 [Methanoregula sp. SKADARSKE-2]